MPPRWREAEFIHLELHSSSLMPMLSAPWSDAEKVKAWREMLAICPRFYPAHMELGTHLLCRGNAARGKEHLDRGLGDLMALAEKPDETLAIVVENLESLWRYDVLRPLLERVIQRYPRTAWYHDALALAAAWTGDPEAAMKCGQRALELEPGSADYLSNLGFFALMAGRLEEADRFLTRALSKGRKHKTARGNRHVLDFLRKHGGTYLDYILRPADRDKLDALANREDVEAVDRVSAELNECRLEAFAQDALARCAADPLPNRLSTLRAFFGFVSRVSADAYFLYEDVRFVREHFVALMNKFIFKFRDVDAELLEDIDEALRAFYGFLSSKRVVSKRDASALAGRLGAQRKPLLRKVVRYNAARNDPTLGEEEREKLQDKLFDGDHVWPHI
ncbi:MAG: hypothetical protein HYZ53_30725 [Planctomycetes bacterium]|nr:hypothetical protein [Planctomycetota bacterium]